MVNFEFIEHTADIGIRVRATTLAELFQNTACALFSIIIEIKPLKEIQKNIIVEAETLEDLLVFWLNELISILYTENFLPSEYVITIDDREGQKLLNAVVSGQDFDPYSNKLDMEIKAATFHNLKIDHSEDGYIVEVIFDT
ncbi:MAG: archease [Candidatus Omnitrophota bacterium]